MDKDFKISLLKLYPFYDRVTGPYERKDGRKHICLNNSKLPNRHPNKIKSLSWPKALMEVKLGRLLTSTETVDHIDENFKNDDFDNLQILSRVENIKKSFKSNPAKKLLINCPECNIEFEALERLINRNVREGKAGPFCSRVCAGFHNQKIQVGRLAQLVEASDLSSVE